MTGEPPVLTAQEFVKVFGGRISAVLAGGTSRIGHASTVLRVEDDSLDVLRQGAITEDVIRAFPGE